MAYESVFDRVNWEDEPSVATPVNQNNLNKSDSALKIIDGRVVAMDSRLTQLEGYEPRVMGYAQDAENSKENSEAYAAGTINGVDVTSSSLAYHNNSKWYSEQAGTAAAGAATSKQDSEAYAIGKVNGVDVTSSHFAFHNNAKWYSEQASGSATSASTSAGSASDSASDAEAYSAGTRQSSPISSDDPAYHNNAKYYLEQAVAAATSAANSKDAAFLSEGRAHSSEVAAASSAYKASISATNAASSEHNASVSEGNAAISAASASSFASTADNRAVDSEAWAVGKRNGQDVPSSDPTYHNNAEYWAGQAQQAAGGGHVIVDESGSLLPQRSKLKFLNAEVTDDEENDTTIVNPQGGTTIVTPPTVVVDSYTYNGSPQGPTITWATGMSDYCVVTNATQTDAGSYQLTIALKNTAKMVWNDGESGLSTADKIYNYSIAKANQTITLSSNSVTLDKDHLTADVTVSGAQGAISATTSDNTIATASVSGSTITISNVNQKTGSATITVNVAGTDNYTAFSGTVSVMSTSFSRVMTIILDFNDSNPSTWATYADDAVGMTAGSSAWDDFFGIYECMLLNGVEGKKLSPNNLAQHLDGTSADITSGAEGDVMTKFPKRGWKVTKGGANNKVVTISLTNDPNKSGYCYKAHYYKGQSCSAIYRGCFKGYETGGKLWSLSGKTITASKTIGAFRTLAQAKGTGYEQSTYYTMQLLQIMYLLKYKGADARTAIGRGYVDGNSAAVATGGTIAKGRDWGEITGKQQMCFLGQEDFFGNIWEWIDGLVTNSSRNYLVCDTTQNIAFNDAGTNYSNVGGGWSSNQGNYISMVIGTNDAPLTASEFSGSETTFLCNYAYAGTSCVARFGGRWSDASLAGAFLVLVSSAASTAHADLAARLMFFEVEAA